MYLWDIHDGVAAQGSCGGQVVEAEQRGDDSVLIDAPDHGAVHEEYGPVLVYRNAYSNRL